MSWDGTALAHVTTGDLATASRQNAVLDDISLLKTSIADDGRVAGELKAFREEITTVSFSATPTFDLSLSNTFKITLTGNITAITVSNWTASKAAPVTIRLTQDGSGGHTVAIPAGWKGSNGIAPAVATGASKTTIIVLYSDDGGTTIFASTYVVNA